MPGESPPPRPRTCFGRDELIEKVVDLAENLTPTALIGAGGIGKTSIALTVLHHDRIKQRFKDNRRFIRCDQFHPSPTHFLRRLSKVIGAGVENPEDLTPLRPFLSSREMIIILDNAESILDPRGADAREMYTLVDELSQFETICLCITSRISTVPRHCKRPPIPTLSMESACDIFYGIHDNGDRSDVISDLLRRLVFHALSITLLATTASYNMWDYDRVAQEWDAHRVKVLRTDYNESLAATIELSLASPTFRELGPDARSLLGVIAFFPQGVDEKNINWLFPTISDRRNIFDKFCALSLIYRSNGFTTMLAPLRDYLCPEDPMLSPLLNATKKQYFSRLSADVTYNGPGFAEARWIMSEDVNVEHLVDVFTTVDANSNEVWDACCHFIDHLHAHKPRLVAMRPKIEGLPEDHHSKPECIFRLSKLFYAVGNHAQQKKLLDHALRLWRKRGDDYWVVQMLVPLADANRLLGLLEEGIEQAKEALEITKRFDDKPVRAVCWHQLALLLFDDDQLDAAEGAIAQALDILPGTGDQFRVCQLHRLLGRIHHAKGKIEKAISHQKTALGIATSSDWDNEQFWINLDLGELFLTESMFDDAHAHAESAKLHAVSNVYNMGRAMELKGKVWCGERKFEDAKAETLLAAEAFERAGATEYLERCRVSLKHIERELEKSATLGEFLEVVLPPAPVNSALSQGVISDIPFRE